MRILFLVGSLAIGGSLTAMAKSEMEISAGWPMQDAERSGVWSVAMARVTEIKSHSL